MSSKKIVLLGHFGVGKTSLIRRFVENEFSNDYKVTIGVHILKKEVRVNDTSVNLILWDIEGTDSIKNFRESYLLGSHAFVYVFDLSRPSTYENISEDISYLQNAYPNTLIKIIGNKIDLVEQPYFKTLSSGIQTNVDFFTSAKTSEKVEEVFETLAQLL